MYHSRIVTIILWIFAGAYVGDASAQASAGDIKVSDQTETPTKGIFVSDHSVVFCSNGNPVHFTIEHNQNFQINCDPDPATPAGIRYLLLKKKIPGEHIRNLDSLLNLPLHRKDGEVVVLGNGVVEDMVLREDQLSALGLERPFEVWIVPFISHNIHSDTFEGHFEGGDQCLDFNLQTAISLTALNKIILLFRPTRQDAEGNLEILYNEVWGTGGLPELYPQKSYHVNMIDSESGDTMSIIRTGDGKERFKPFTKTGSFYLWINDSLGCESGGFGGYKFVQPTVEIYSRDDYAHQGDIRCLPVFADNFFDMKDFRIRTDWDPAELSITGITGINPLLTSGTIDIDSTMAREGSLTFSWSDEINNFKLVPGTKLFEICYRVLGGPGTRTEVTFHESDTYFDTGNFLSEWNDSAGTITVGPETWNAVRDYTYCYTGRDSVDVTFYTLGSFPPFTMEIPEAGIVQSGVESNEVYFQDFPIGEFSYRLTDSRGNTHFVRNAIHIPPGSPVELSLQEAISPECGAQDGLIKLETIAHDYQYIHMAGPGKEENYPQKNLFEDLTSGTYTFTTLDVNDCPSVPLIVNLSGGSAVDISIDIQDESCDETLSTVVLNVHNENNETVNTTILLDQDRIFASGTQVEISAGTHMVEVQDPDYCDLVKEIIIPEVSAPNSVRLKVLNPEVKQGEPFTVEAEYKQPDDIASHQWQPTMQLQQDGKDEATFILNASAWIGITALDDRGCTYSDSIFINISEDVQPEETLSMFLPNAISPNGDGQNDHLRIFSQDPNLTVEDIHIYDRYGNILFQSTGPFNDRILWDGRVNAKTIPPGVYVVQLRIRKSDQSLIELTETVTILR